MKIDYYNYMVEVLKLRPTNLQLTTNEHQDIECIMCGSIFNATPKSKVHNYKKSNLAGCPKCTMDERFKEEKQNILNKLHEYGFIIHNKFRSKHDPISVTNTNCSCGRSWITQREYLKSGNSFCKPCNDERKRERLKELSQRRIIVDDGTWKTYRKLVYRYTRITYNENKDIINPNNYERKLSGKGGYHLDHIVSVRRCYDAKVPATECASINNLRMVFWKDNAIKYSKPTIAIPEFLRKYFNNSLNLHRILLDQIKEYTNDFTEFFQLEDGYFDFKIDKFLIKICPFSDYKEQTLKSKTYLSNLISSAESEEYSCFVIFEHEILTKLDIVMSRILNKLQKTPNKIYARNCKIVSVDTKTKTKFFNENHMQGTCISSHNYALVYSDEIVAMMSFNGSRMGIGVKDEGYELTRYSNKLFHVVVGGASKLFKHFLEECNPEKIISYSDNRWGNGNMYINLGMQYRRSTNKNYWYLKDGNIKHRFGFAKHALSKRFSDKYDPSKTEYANMISFGYDRIWDCGSRVFIYETTS